ncbi:MAG: LPS export ABC transporter periplasmic protein LptC [bacterium]
MSLPRDTLLILLVPTFLTLSCGRGPGREEEVPGPPPEGPVPESEQWDARIQLYEKGLRRAFIEAEHLAVYQLPDQTFTHMDTIRARFFDEAGEASSRLTARAGRIFDQEREGMRRVKTWGDVVLRGEEQRVVRADTLWWDEGRDRVYTEGPVEVTEGEDVLRGVGFESDAQLRDMTIHRASGTSPRGGERVREEMSAPPPDTASVTPDTSAGAGGDGSGRRPG